MEFYDPESPTEDNLDDGSTLELPSDQQEQQQLQHVPFLQQQQQQAPFLQQQLQHVPFLQQHAAQQFIQPEQQLLPAQKFQLLLQHQQFCFQQRHRWNAPELSGGHQPSRMLFPRLGMGPVLSPGMGPAEPEAVSELEDVDMRVQHRVNRSAWYFEQSPTLQGTLEATTGVDVAQGEMASAMKTSTPETAQRLQADLIEPVQEEAQSSLEQHPVQFSPPLTATDAAKEDPNQNEESPKEPQTLAKLLLSKALGNVSKADSITPSTVSAVSSNILVPGKLAFIMKPGKVQKVSFGIRSKKTVLKTPEEENEEEEEGAQIQEDNTSNQPARFKKSMAELFRPDQDGPADVSGQQQLLQLPDNTSVQLMKQSADFADGQSSGDNKHQLRGDAESKEEGSNQKDNSAEVKERKTRRATRWSQPEEKESDVFKTEETAVSCMQVKEDNKAKATSDQPTNGIDKQCLLDPKLQAHAENFMLYKDVIDDEPLTEKEQRQKDLDKTNLMAVFTVETRLNKQGEKQEGQETADESDLSQNIKQNEETDPRSQQADNSNPKMDEIKSVQESSKGSSRGDNKKCADNSKSHHDHRSHSRSQDRSSRRKDHEDSRSHHRESDRKTDHHSDRRSISRDGRTERRSKTDKEKERRRRHRSRSEDRNKETSRKDRSGSMESHDRRQSKSKDSSTKKHSHSEVEDKKRHQDRSDSRERSESTTQNLDHDGSSEKRQMEARYRSRSQERRWTQFKDYSKSVEKSETKRRDQQKSVERPHTQNIDHMKHTEGIKTEHRDSSSSGERRESQCRELSNVERRETQCRDRSRSVEIKERRQHTDDRRSEEKRETEDKDHSRSVELKETEHASHCRNENIKETQCRDLSKSMEGREKQCRDHNGSVERRETQPKDNSRGAERKETQHRDHNRSVEPHQGHSRSPEGRPVEHRFHSIYAERRQTEHWDQTKSAERMDTKQSQDYSSGVDNREKQTRDSDMKMESKHNQQQSKDSYSIIDGSEQAHSDKSHSRYRSMSLEKEARSKQHSHTEGEAEEKSKHGYQDKESRSCKKDITCLLADGRDSCNQSGDDAQFCSGTDSSEYLHRGRDQSPVKERNSTLPDERKLVRSPDRGRNRSPNRGRNIRSPDRERNRSPHRGRNRSQDRMRNRSLDRGPITMTQERDRNIKLPDSFRNAMTPDRFRNIRSPERGVYSRSPDRSRYNWSPDGNRSSGSSDRQRNKNEGHLDTYQDYRSGGHHSDWKDDYEQYPIKGDSSERFPRGHHGRSDFSGRYFKDERQIRDDELPPCPSPLSLPPHYIQDLSTGINDQLIRYSNSWDRESGGGGSRASLERHFLGSRSDISKSHRFRQFEDFTGREHTTGFETRAQGVDEEWRLDTWTSHPTERKSEQIDYHREDGFHNRRAFKFSKCVKKRKSKRKGLKLKLKSRSTGIGGEGQVCSENADGSVHSDAHMKMNTNTDIIPGSRIEPVRTERFKDSGKLDESVSGERISRKGDHRKGDLSSDHVKTARTKFEVKQSDTLETTRKDEKDFKANLPQVDISSSEKVHATSSESDRASYHRIKSSDLKKNVMTFSVLDQSVRADQEVKQKSKLPSDNGSDEKSESDTINPSDSCSQILEKQGSIAVEKLETLGTLKTESQVTIVSSQRTKAGRFGTASWSSGSKRRERGTLMAVRSMSAPVAKQASAGPKSSLSVSNSESDSVSSFGSAGTDSKKANKLSDGGKVSDSTPVQKTVSSVAGPVEQLKESVSVSSALQESWGEVGKGNTTPEASSVTIADVCHQQHSTVNTDSRKGNSDSKSEPLGRSGKSYLRKGDRDNHSEKDLEREEKSRDPSDCHTQPKEIRHRQSNSPSYREKGRNEKRPNKDDEWGRWDSQHLDDGDFKGKECGRIGSNKRQDERDRRHIDDQERQEKDHTREHERVQQGQDDEHEHKGHFNRGKDLELNESLDRNDPNDSALQFSPISPEGSTDLNDDELGDFQPHVTPRVGSAFCGTDSFRQRGSGQSFGNIHGHGPRLSINVENDHVEQFPKPQRERSYDHRRERSPGPVESQMPRFLDHMSNRPQDRIAGRPHTDGTEKWGEEKHHSYRDFCSDSVWNTVESVSNLNRNIEQHSQDNPRYVGEHLNNTRSHSEEREQGHLTFTRSGSLERDQILSALERNQYQRGETDKNCLASHTIRSHCQERDQRFIAHNRSRSNSQEMDRSQGQESEQRVFTRNIHQDHTSERENKTTAQNKSRSERHLKKESLYPEGVTHSHERDRRPFAYESGQLTLERSSIFNQETDQRQYMKEEIGSQSLDTYRELYPKAVENQSHFGRGGGIDMEKDSKQEEDRRAENEIVQGAVQKQSQLNRPMQPEKFLSSTYRDPRRSALNSIYSLDRCNQGQSRGDPRLFERGIVNPALVGELGISSRTGVTASVPMSAELLPGLPHINPGHSSVQLSSVGHNLPAHCLPDQAVVQYPEIQSDSQSDMQAAAYLRQIDPATLELMLHQYQLVGYSHDQALAFLTKCISSSIAKHFEPALIQLSQLHCESTVGTAIATFGNMTSGSVFDKYQQQTQQLNTDLHPSSQSISYPPRYDHYSQVPLDCLKDTGVMQPEHTVTAHMLNSTGQGIKQKGGEQSKASGLSATLIKTSKHVVETQSVGKPNLSLETSTHPGPEERQIKTGSETEPLQQANLSKEEGGVFTSNSSGAVSPKDQEPSSIENLSVQPLKVKSRWRRSCEAEAMRSSLVSELPSKQKPEVEASILGKRTQDGESSAPMTSHKQRKLTAEIGQLVKTEDEDAFPNFQRIQDNINLTQRKRSKSMKRMQCDCTGSKADRAKGVPSCGEDCLNRMLMIECGSKCRCLANCSNKRFQKKQYAKTEPFFCGPNKGWGLRAVEDLPLVGTFVLEYVGELLGYKEFVRRIRQYSRQGLKHHYFMVLNADEVIDATFKGNNSRFLNHSCDPNCETQKWTVNGELRVGLFTKKTIHAGEELTFDYQFEFYGEPQKCCCGAENCHGIIGGLKKFPQRKKSKERARDHIKCGRFEDEMLDEDMDSMSYLENGLKLKDHVLDLCRLMVRARKPKHRQSLLKILQNTTEVNCLRLFVGYQGLPLLWSWMVDLGDSEDDCNLKMLVLSVLQKLPITNRTVLKESKIMALVEMWASPKTPRPLPEAEEADPASEPKLPLPLPPDRPVVSILTLHKDIKVRRTPKKRVTFADEAVHSDNEMVSSTNNEVYGESKAMVCPPTGQAAGNEYSVSTSDTGVLNSLDTDGKCEGDSSKKESGAGSGESQDLMSQFLTVLYDRTSSVVTDSSDGTSLVNPILLTEVITKPEEAAQCTLAEELCEESKEAESNLFEQDDKSSTETPTDCIAENKSTSKTEPHSSTPELLIADITQMSKQVKESDVPSPVVIGNVQGESSEFSTDQPNSRQLENAAEDGAGPPQLECMEAMVDEDLAVPSTSQEGCFVDEDEEMPTLVKEGGECGDEDGETEALDPVCSMASQLMCSWTNLKEVYRIPKKHRLEERKRTERELECKRPEFSEIDPFALWKKKSWIKSHRKNNKVEEWDLRRRSQAALEAAGSKMTKDIRRQLFEAKVKAEELMNAELHRQHEALLQQQQAAAALILQQNPSLAAVLQSLGQQDPCFISAQGHQVYDSSSHQQYSSRMTAKQHQALLMAVHAAGGNVAMLTEQLLSQQGLMARALDPSQQHQEQQQLAMQQMASQQMSTAPPFQQSPTMMPLTHCLTSREDEDVPPPLSPPEQCDSLPDHWKMARDTEGHVYYYNILTRATQWDFPNLDESSSAANLNMDTAEVLEDEGELDSRKKTTTAAADTSSEVARKIKEQFRKQMSKFVVVYLDPYRRPDCKIGRIQTTEDFKHLARRLTHHVLVKELKHCRHVEDLEVNENVKGKARDYVRKYMSRFGSVYKKSSSPDDFRE